MAPWCIHISCFERVARSGSGRGSVRGLVGAMDAELSRPDWLATVQSGRKQAQSRVCMPGFICSVCSIQNCGQCAKLMITRYSSKDELASLVSTMASGLSDFTSSICSNTFPVILDYLGLSAST